MSSTSSSEYSDIDMEEDWKQKYEELEEKYNAIKQKYAVEEITVKSEFDAKEKLSSSTKEEISLVIDEYDRKREEWPNVKKITINHFGSEWKKWFNNQTFPNVERLHIDCSLMIEDECRRDYEAANYSVQNSMDTIFSNMKNLKHIYLRSEVPKYACYVYGPDKLETADVNWIYPFIEKSSGTLKEFNHCFEEGEGELIGFFDGYPVLEKLSGVFYIRASYLESLPENYTITHLNIHVTFWPREWSSKEPTPEEDRENFKLILSAIPMLEELIVYFEITSDLIEFVKHNLQCLEKLIGRGGIAADAKNPLNRPKRKRNINTDFEIILEEDRPWRKEFGGLDKKKRSRW